MMLRDQNCEIETTQTEEGETNPHAGFVNVLHGMHVYLLPHSFQQVP